MGMLGGRRWRPPGRATRRVAAVLVAGAGLAALASPALADSQVKLRVVNGRTLKISNDLTLQMDAPIPAAAAYDVLINRDDAGDPQQPEAACFAAAATDTIADAAYPANCTWPSIHGMGPGMGPVSNIVWHGDRSAIDASHGPSLPDGRYLISVLVPPFDMQDSTGRTVHIDGYKLDGVHVTLPLKAGEVPTVTAEPNPLPLATVRVDVFEDLAPTNGERDVDQEPGLAGFEGHLADVLGPVTTDWFGNPLCTEYQTLPDQIQVLSGTPQGAYRLRLGVLTQDVTTAPIAADANANRIAQAIRDAITPTLPAGAPAPVVTATGSLPAGVTITFGGTNKPQIVVLDQPANTTMQSQVTQNAGTNVLDQNGDPIVLKVGGKCLSNDQGEIVIPNLGPGKYATTASLPSNPAPRTDGNGHTWTPKWIQTSTLEGYHDWDNWVQEGSSGYDPERLDGSEAQAFVPLGFVDVNAPAQVGPGASTATGGIEGTAVSTLSWVPDASTTAVGGVFDNEQMSQIQDGPIPNAWIAIGDLRDGDQTKWTGQADAEGHFKITGIPDGDYNLTVWDEEQNYILNMQQVQVTGGTVTDVGAVLVAQWWAQLSGDVFVDRNENGRRDPGEPGVPGQAVTLRGRDNSLRDSGQNTAITDVFGHYEFRQGYPLVQWVVAEVYNDRYRATGYTYQSANDPNEHVVQQPGVVDVGVEGFIGQKTRLDWGVKQYDPGTNGGIVGVVSYGTTRNELNPAEAAIEDWQPGLAGVQVSLYYAKHDVDGNVVKDPDGSVAIDTAKGVDGLVPMRDGDNPTTTETWQRPKECLQENADGALLTAADMPWIPKFANDPSTPDLQKECVEGLAGGQQVQDLSRDTTAENATLNGNYGFGYYLDGNGDEQPLPAGDYVVKVDAPKDSTGTSPFTFTREEDINVFSGDTFSSQPTPLPGPEPQVQIIPCAGANHVVDVKGITKDAQGNDVPDGPDAVDNPTFADAGGSPYEGQEKPLCDAKLVHLDPGRSVAPSFEMFTAVPIPARMWGLIIDDLQISTDPREILYGDKQGIPHIPVGLYDFAGRLKHTIETDRNGFYEVLLPSTDVISCPTPSGVCPNVYRLVGNDPGTPDHPNKDYDPNFKVQQTNWQVSPGVYEQSDLALIQNATQVLAPGALLSHPAQCTLAPQIPQVLQVDRPAVRLGDAAAANRTVTVLGDHFGGTRGTITLGGTALGATSITSWTDTAITFVVPPTAAQGPQALRIQTSAGYSTVNGLTMHLIGTGRNAYAPAIVTVDPRVPRAEHASRIQTGTYSGRTSYDGSSYQTIQEAINAVADVTPVSDVGAAETAPATNATPYPTVIVVKPGIPRAANPTGAYEENVIVPTGLELQGVGPGGFRSDGSFVPGADINGAPWDVRDQTAWWNIVAGLSIQGDTPVSDGEVIYVVSDGRAASFGPNVRARIDGFRIRGGHAEGLPNGINPLGGGPNPNPVPGSLAAEGVGTTQGGGIFVHGYARNLQITNNVIEGNGGQYGGGIRLGGPNVGSSHNENITISDNQILKNGGVSLAGAIGIFNGSDGYQVLRNDICGNFSAEYGAGISQYGLSPNGTIASNRIYFNASYDEGSGIFIGSELPTNPDVLPAGTGAETISGNVIQANISNDDGGGIRLLSAFGPVDRNGKLSAATSLISIVNNQVVGNISTHEGGGIALDDAPYVNVVDDTVMNNKTTATAMTSNDLPAPAGLSSTANTDQLQAALPDDAALYAWPTIVNSIFWDNRAGTFSGGDVTGIGLKGDPGPIEYWDVGVSDSSVVDGNPLTATSSMFSVANPGDPGRDVTDDNDQFGVNPQVVQEYPTTIRTSPLRADPQFIGNTIVALDVPATRQGDYHLKAGSPAINAGATGSPVPNVDIDGQARPQGGGQDVGADEWTNPPAVGLNAKVAAKRITVAARPGTSRLGSPTRRPPAGRLPYRYTSSCKGCVATLRIDGPGAHRTVRLHRLNGAYRTAVSGLRPGVYRLRVRIRYANGAIASSASQTITVSRRSTR